MSAGKCPAVPFINCAQEIFWNLAGNIVNFLLKRNFKDVAVLQNSFVQKNLPKRKTFYPGLM